MLRNSLNPKIEFRKSGPVDMINVEIIIMFEYALVQKFSLSNRNIFLNQTKLN